MFDLKLGILKVVSFTLCIDVSGVTTATALITIQLQTNNPISL